MHRLVLILLILSFISPVYAYKVFSYDENGNRVYRTIEQKDFAKYKNRKKRAYVRTPRTNWEVTDQMRARNKRTYSYYLSNR